jgi:transcriptional regulator with XRE-family HTH domain
MARTHGRGIIFDKAEMDRALAQYKHTLTDIAQAMGLSPSAVSYWLRNGQIPRGRYAEFIQLVGYVPTGKERTGEPVTRRRKPVEGPKLDKGQLLLLDQAARQQEELEEARARIKELEERLEAEKEEIPSFGLLVYVRDLDSQYWLLKTSSGMTSPNGRLLAGDLYWNQWRYPTQEELDRMLGGKVTVER